MGEDAERERRRANSAQRQSHALVGAEERLVSSKESFETEMRCHIRQKANVGVLRRAQIRTMLLGRTAQTPTTCVRH